MTAIAKAQIFRRQLDRHIKPIIKIKEDSPVGSITFLTTDFCPGLYITRCEFAAIVLYRTDHTSNQKMLVLFRRVGPLCNNRHVLPGILVLPHIMSAAKQNG